jgi:hypothetical protein
MEQTLSRRLHSSRAKLEQPFSCGFTLHFPPLSLQLSRFDLYTVLNIWIGLKTVAAALELKLETVASA